MKKIRIVIADDQGLIRDGLRTILDLEDDMEVVGQACNGREAYDLCKTKNPDIVLMDVRMPSMDGIESTRLIKANFPGIKVLILTTFDDEEYIIHSLYNGACGYLSKDIEGDLLISSIRDAVNNKLIMQSDIAAKLAAAALAQQVNRKGAINGYKENCLFSDREKEIACLMVQGHTNKQIARELFISEGTVKNYISAIYGKIGVKDRTKAVLLLRRQM